MTGVIQPPGGILFLQEIEGKLMKVTVCTRTLHVKSQEFLEQIPKEWTERDVKELLDEGRRFLEN
ncbi:MAG: hypothetical protein ABS939_00350 [Psychrobacillus sp.]